MQLISPIRRVGLLVLLASGLVLMSLVADQIEMVNGDRYTGKLISVSETEVKWKSDVQGIIQLPREKVSVISFGQRPVASRPAAPARSEAAADLSISLGEIVTEMKAEGVDPNLLEKVRNEWLSGAGPEASDQFNRMVSGLISNEFSVKDIQTEAKKALTQLEELKKDFDDPDISMLLNQYGAILNAFVKRVDAETKEPAPKSAEPPGAPAKKQ